ncbi:hypothetical protein J14TS2_29180 [Bacillus sp. J14TS2]|uniref:M23 family metallopeptidase n=1 Tax=Bacillus sp. J14TS2 TaxID=2807188 RepID=UPI001B16BF22|nr:M23 family metallopeptidase [Bacillus sp. J14TS2]GIN72443.1 hypothetical protein J14TS2_29180 [Bacillus sp. J14TS2]
MNLHGRRNKVGAYLIMTISVLALIMSGTPSAQAETNLHTIYHVYMDEEYLGSVSSKAVVESEVDKLIEEETQKYKDYQLELANDLTYIEEDVFRAESEDDAIREKIAEKAKIQAISTAITVKDEAIVYVKNEEVANKVIERFQQEYVPEAQWKAYQENEDASVDLKKDESKITDIKMKEDTSLQEVVVDPKDILEEKQAVEFLQKGTLEEKQHEVQEGEVLESIANEYNLSTKELMELNEGITEDTVLQIGQELQTVVTKPLLHVVVEKELYQEESVPFEKEVIENDEMPKGETKTKQAGKNGTSGFLYQIVEENGSQKKKETKKETQIKKPVKEVIEKGTKVVPDRGSGTFAWPTNGGYVSSKMGQRWGSLHKGIDIARPDNLTIKAADNGVVVSAGWDDGGYGNKVVIDHQNGFQTVYAHMDSISVSAGQKVEKGSELGIMGATGFATGVHLHFEVHKDGNLKDPLSYL